MKAIHILLVEDNEGDIMLTREAFEEGTLPYTLSIARDGKEAIQFLEKEDRFSHVETPHLILLDINLPKKNGHEVLQIIKKSESLKHIPVIMLSTSSSEMDIAKSYENHANCHIIKPIEVDDFVQVVASIESFWLNTAQLPGKVKHR